MKNRLHFLLVLILALAALSACAPGTATTAPADNKALYAAAIERYYNAYIHADVDELLDSIDPTADGYPDAETIESMRASAVDNVLQGSAAVQDMTVLGEGPATATVETTILLSIDLHSDGQITEQAGTLSVELRFSDGKWRIFDMVALTADE